MLTTAAAAVALAGAATVGLAGAVAYPAGISPHTVAVGDFKGDGKPDRAIAGDPLSGTVSVLLGP